MNIYIVAMYDIESYDIKGIFSSREKAEKYKAACEAKEYEHWKKWATDENPLATDEDFVYLCDTFNITEYEVDKEIKVEP